MLMGRYAVQAQNIAKRIGAAMHEKASEEEAYGRTAENMVGNLQDFAADMNAALKKDAPKFEGELQATPWKKEGQEVVSTLSATRGKKSEVRVALSIGGDVSVNGKGIPHGESPMTAVQNEVLKILRSEIDP
jgi:hypothetical protein